MNKPHPLRPSIRPALLLLDLRLPDCFGDELLTLLRSEPGWQDLPAVAVTTEPGFELAGSGFLELWRKPMNLQGALARLDDLLDLRGGGPADCVPHRHSAPLSSRCAPG